MYIDFAAIKQNIDIAQVLDLFGEDYSLKKSFKCVSKEHKDNSPSMSINHKNNTCHCFSCGATFNPLSLTMEETGLSVYEAGKYLIENLGLDKKAYCQEMDAFETNGDRFPYTKDELESIGLKANYSFATVTSENMDTFFEIERSVMEEAPEFNMTEDQIKEEILFKERMALRRMKHNARISLVTMYFEDKEGFYSVIESACLNNLDRLLENREDLEKLFKEEKAALFKTASKEERNEVINTYIDLMTDKENKSEITDKAAKILTTDRAKEILKRYFPLQETHKIFKEMDERMEYLNDFLDTIPGKYRTLSIDAVIENNRDTVKACPGSKGAEIEQEEPER